MSIAIENLPACEQITNELVRDAAAAFSAARAAADEAKKTCVQLEQELPNAQQEDARADELLRSEGKAPLKGRPATQAAEKGIAAAAHEQRVAELALDRARNELVAALDQHGDVWRGEVAEQVVAMTGQWQAVTGELIDLHGRLTASLRIARNVGVGDLPAGIGALPFERRQIDNCEFVSGQPKVPAFISTGDVLAALAGAVALPEAPPEPVEHGPLPRRSSPLADHAGVRREIDERNAFAERARSPERVEERRRRSEATRAGRDAAVAEQAAS